MNPLLLLSYAELFWQDYHTPVEILIVLLTSGGVFVKWVVDDFRRSRVSAITWLFAVSSLLGTIWVATYLTSPAAQVSLDQWRHHRDALILLSLH
jgi:hypothetical protein